MAIWFENLVCQGVFFIGEHSSTFLCSHDHFIRDMSTIEEETFIVLEDPFSVSMVVTRTFIVLNGPPEDGERVTISIEGHTPSSIVPRFSCPMDVPPKPLDVVTASKSSVHDDHF